MNFSLTKDDSDDIGFALSCLESGAIHFREFHEWLYYVIEHCEDPPAYIFDMLGVKVRVDFKPGQIMGWTAGGNLTDSEMDALDGISFLRKICSYEDTISRQDAIQILQERPKFARRVKDFFPFIDLNTVVGPDPDKGW